MSRTSPTFDSGLSDDEGLDSHEIHDDGADSEHELEGDYTAQMEALMEEDDDVPLATHQDNDSDEEDFVYSGVDSNAVTSSYRDTLRDVLEQDLDESDDEREEVEMRNSAAHDIPTYETTEEKVEDSVLSTEPSQSSLSPQPPVEHASTKTTSQGISTPSLRIARPYLHPTISRLRSALATPSASSRAASSADIHRLSNASHSNIPSSRASSTSDSKPHKESDADSSREVFRWTHLQNAGAYLFNGSPSAKAATVLGSSGPGEPTVLAANGFVCVGTTTGRLFIFDFKQNLKFICGDESSASSLGPVTSLALSHDHTWIGAGYASGHIQLFDLNHPETPARIVRPTNLGAVASGRQEGHLQGTRVVGLDFVAGRHTAIVSADTHGLAFYHSLGKVLFVEASDTLRILGKYPEAEDLPVKGSGKVKDARVKPTITFRPRKARYTILAMSPLPLGTEAHRTDAYNLIAMLTPAKLVIVGLKPTPKTWHKQARVYESPSQRHVKGHGCLAWWPSTTSSKEGAAPATPQGSSSEPLLAYSWGSTMHLARVSETLVQQSRTNTRTGKTIQIDVGLIDVQSLGKCNVQAEILALQWLNANQIVVATSNSLLVYNAPQFELVEHAPFDSSSLVSPAGDQKSGEGVRKEEAARDIAHSFRVYKGRIFTLCRDSLQVGSLLTWADRVLSCVQDGNFLSAIDLTRSYYTGEAPGNRNGLPDDLSERQVVIGQKMQELMLASANYAFSEDRMTDGTHFSPDGRGVDLTDLFEGMVTTCARACIALDDLTFFFEDLFQRYEDTGIVRMFLQQLEPFVLRGEIKEVPPHITQKLVAMHVEDERPDIIEKLIWHIDPMCLDIDQAISVCQKYKLYDALIYVYTRAMRDFVSPIVELFSLIRQVERIRRGLVAVDEAELETLVLNAYKIYPYLANVLSGLTYPSEEPLESDNAFQAKEDIYTFLFQGRTTSWPHGEGGKLVLTSEEEGGSEPTYPYVRVLLRFDAESFLHSLDIAFEDAYFIDDSQAAHSPSISRLVIIKILLEVLSSPPSSEPTDVTFVNIFVAKNVPKYPQSLQMPPTTLHNILVSLARDCEESSREDRQLAAEYLLSVYHPRESDQMLELFESAGFYRILRSWHRQDKHWPQLMLAYIKDPDISSIDVLTSVDSVLAASKRSNRGVLPSDIINTVSGAVSQLLTLDITHTARLVDKYSPALHSKAVSILGDRGDEAVYIYLRCLLGPPSDDEDHVIPRPPGPSPSVPPPLRNQYVRLQCQVDSSTVIDALKYLPRDYLQWSEIVEICEDAAVYNAAVWAASVDQDPRQALSKADKYERSLTMVLAKAASSSTLDPIAISNKTTDAHKAVNEIDVIGRLGITICLSSSQGASVTEVPLEDIWFQLLSTQINCVQGMSTIYPPDALSGASDDPAVQVQQYVMTVLRTLVQETFSALVSVSSTRAVSFPRLFKRLVETATTKAAPSSTSSGNLYSEFRTILTGMLESYRSDGDMLIISKHLVDRDLFETVELFSKERNQGWAPSQASCSACRENLVAKENRSVTAGEEHGKPKKIVVSRTGKLYHATCWTGQ